MDEGFPDFYQLEGEIGRGAFCTVEGCIDRRNNEYVSVKIIDVPKMTVTTGLTIEDIEREVHICSKLKHPHIVQILSAYKVDDAIYMVTEYMDGVDLCEEIINRVNAGFVYSEAVASHYVRQVFEALAFIHERNIVHRDMKPHNIILASKDDTAPVKITDFSVAIELPPENCIRSGRIGTPHFMSPEVVKREPYDCAVDIWGCGVILFILLSGSFPFHGTGDKIFDAIEKGKFTMKSRQWQSISERARDLVICMLTLNPKERITADGVLSHPWLLDRDHSSERMHLKDSVDELRKFNARKKLKGEVIASLARRQIEDDTDSWTDNQFQVEDRIGSGISEQDLTDSAVVAQLIDSLEDIQLLAGGRKEDILFLQWLFEIPSLHSLLEAYEKAMLERFFILLNGLLKMERKKSAFKEIHSKVSQVTRQKLAHTTEPKAVESLDQVISAIELLASPDEKSLELKDLLKDTHITALMNSYDETLREVQSGGVVPCMTNNTVDLTDSIAENLTRVRLVQFTKSGTEPLGVTLKINDDNKCVVARIIHGGMIHRQGTLHVGDEIKEINGISVARQSVENLQSILLRFTTQTSFHWTLSIKCEHLQPNTPTLFETGVLVCRTLSFLQSFLKILREATGDVTFKIVPNMRNSEVEEKKKFVRTLFDYDPRADDFIPCQQAGIAFKRGEVLQIVSQADNHWWQAVRAGDTQKAGLIPSPELQELKIASHAVGKSKKDGSVKCFWKGMKKKKKIGKYIARHNSVFDQLDLLTYEEVSYMNSFKRKTIVLIGAHGVGRRHIKNSLIARFPEKYAYPIPHTSREPRVNEEHGKQYYFVSKESMLMDSSSHQFLEYGTHEYAMYGTKLDTIRDVVNNGYLAVLDVEPPALKILRCAEFAPFVVFIAAPTNLPQRGDKFFDESLNRLVSESEALKEQFGHFFDVSIVNHNIEDTIEELVTALEELEKPQWIPTCWLY